MPSHTSRPNPNNPFLAHVQSLPGLLTDCVPELVRQSRAALDAALANSIERVVITGCGDSYFAGLCAQLAFEELAGLDCDARAAMDASRYARGTRAKPASLVIGVSVSGGVSRTIEAVARARKRGATALAITSSPETPLAKAADLVLVTRVPDLPDAHNVVVPGSRSFYASLVALFACAIRLGELRGAISSREADTRLDELASVCDATHELISQNEVPTRTLAEETLDAPAFVFVGSGPNFGSAHFAAAKLTEACGDLAFASDIEEWAHVQYFHKRADVPTFLLSPRDPSPAWRDRGRVDEVAMAMRAIGRRVVRPELPACDEMFSPLLTCVTPMLFAAHRAELLGEPYFRGFGGGRSIEGGGGISRIRTSDILVD